MGVTIKNILLAVVTFQRHTEHVHEHSPDFRMISALRKNLQSVQWSHSCKTYTHIADRHLDLLPKLTVFIKAPF